MRQNLLRASNDLTNKHYETSYAIFDYDNQLLILKQYLQKTDQLINQLFPTKRIHKRSIADGLGSFIKILTGNLDAKDGQRYEQLINTLSQSSEKQKTILLEQTQILNDTINTFSENIRQLSQNQNILNANLHKMFKQVNKDMNVIFGKVSTQTLLDQSIFSLQLLINTLEELENSLTFAQNHQVHLSLINNDDLTIALSNISQNLQTIQINTKNQLELPYPVTPENLHLYESLIKIKAYQKDSTFTFIYEIPLIKNIEYQFIQLIPFPAFLTEKKFQMTIPTYNNILFNTKFSIPIDFHHCTPVSTHYFCDQVHHFTIPNDKLCETQLLSFSNNQTCNPYLLELQYAKIIPITKSSWIISSPTKIVADIKCKNSLTRKSFEGSNIIHITPDCLVQVNHDNVLFTLESTSQQEVSIKLPSVDQIKNPPKSVDLSIVDITHVDMHKLERDQLRLYNQKEKLLQVNDSPVEDNLSIGSLVLSIILLVSLSSAILYVYCKRNSFIKSFQKHFINTNLIKERDSNEQSNPIPLIQIRS